MDKKRKAQLIIKCIEWAFSAAVAAYTIKTLIPKYEKFEGVDPEQLIRNVNNKNKDAE